MPPRSSEESRLVRSLARASREFPLERKLVVAPSFGAGREVLRRLALVGSGWVGFDVTTVRSLAAEIASDRFEAESVRVLDAFERRALLDEALDGALAVGGEDGFAELAEGVGFRDAVDGAVDDLRRAGVDPARLRRARLGDRRRQVFLHRVLERYEALLRERRRADTASVMRRALEVLEAGPRLSRLLPADLVLLVPGLETRGLAGRLVSRLLDGGAVVLEADPVVGVEPPVGVLQGPAAPPETELAHLHAPESVPVGVASAGLSLFAAASPAEELREVLRRVSEEGLCWDQVEVITPDPAAYGSALHALSASLGVPVTYSAGLPVERTRPGRVARAYLDWIEEGFQAAPIRRLIEAGDLRPPRAGRRHQPAELARRFRTLRVGWGRRRYRTQLRAALAAAEEAEARPWESPEAFQRRKERTLGELRSLRSMLFPALKATPSVPDRMGEDGDPVSPAELARGLRAFLRRVPPGRGPDRSAMEQIQAVLDRVEGTLRRRTRFGAASTILRRHLEFTVRAPEPEPRSPDDLGAPYRSEGGHLHLADLAHGGFSGRRHVFVVGLDADRVPGGGGQDPVLLDSDRRVLARDDLATSTDVLRRRIHDVAAVLARLRGRVTLSYSAWNAADARVIAPSPVLLQALRLRSRDPEADYEALREAVGRVVCALPGADRAPLDADDIWMAALGGGGHLRPGLEAVRRTFPLLDRGLQARDARRSGDPGAHHGIVVARPDAMDPRRNPDVVLSASRLEDLGTCPLRYLLRTVLRVYPPDDPELDPDRWLDPLARGRILHAVFERTLRAARERGLRQTDRALETVALEALAQEAARAREEIPSPGEGVTAREIVGLEEDVRSFVRLVREEGAPWVKLELRFGYDEPFALEVAGGTVHLRGAVDRVDENLEGLHVIDYKTGVPRDFQASKGAFNGGRRLQHAVYAAAAERLLGGTVVTGEYHFPTRRGENTVHRFPRLNLASAPVLLGSLLDGVAAGHFVPTDSSDDCRFCDFAEACRARTGDWGRTESPLADWSGERANTGAWEHFTALKRVRDLEG